MSMAFAMQSPANPAILLTPKSEVNSVSKAYCVIISVDDEALGIANRDGEIITLVKIYNSGNILVLAQEGNGTAQCTVDIESLAAGSYTCTIVTSHGSSSAPFTK